MLANRSMPAAEVIPVLAYADAPAAASWLCSAFGFTVRLRIGDHRIQLNVGAGAVVVRSADTGAAPSEAQSVMVRVHDVDAHRSRAVASGAGSAGSPVTHPFGERQYSCQDIGGHWWTFSESLADVPPALWGGELVDDSPP